MFGGNQWFIAGLASFFLAHVGYIIAFFHRSPPLGPPSLLRRRPWLILPFLIFATVLLGLVLPGSGPLKLPVLAYATVIISMTLAALNRWSHVAERSFSGVFSGALLFVISDSMIAIDRFASELLPIPGVAIWIILTYMSAQYLIITGLLEQDWYLYNRK